MIGRVPPDLRGHELDLDPDVLGEPRHGHGGAGRSVVTHEAGVDRVHRLEVGHVPQEDGGLDHVGEGQAGLGQHRLEIPEDALGLFGNPTDDHFHGGRVERDLTGREQEAPGDDPLGIGADGSGGGVGRHGLHGTITSSRYQRTIGGQPRGQPRGQPQSSESGGSAGLTHPTARPRLRTARRVAPRWRWWCWRGRRTTPRAARPPGVPPR